MSSSNDNNDPLSILESHFKALGRFEVRIPGVPGVFFSKPLTMEESLKLLRAINEPNPTKQARMYAELFVAKVETEGGDPAFRRDKHFTAEERILKSVSASSLAGLLDDFTEHLNATAAELEKKSEQPE